VLLIGCIAGGLLAYSGKAETITSAGIVAAISLAFARASLRKPLFLAGSILLALEVFPPFYVDAPGDAPFYISFLLLPLSLVVTLMRRRDLDWKADPVGKGLTAFLLGTLLSIPFAFWLSGLEVGWSSVSRWLFLIHAPVVFFGIRACSRLPPREQGRLFHVLMWGAAFSAVYGIVDFIWPIPLPHPAADQFIWLQGAVLRRAQGVFHESSNFANFCGFFLVAAVAAYTARRERQLGLPRGLLAIFISLFGTAVLVAFSRSTWASVLVALSLFAVCSGVMRSSRLLAVGAALLAPLCLLWAISPDLWEYVVNARVGRLFEIFYDPNFATSGRFDTWVRVIAILRDHPQYLIFGIGYKTLPVTRLFHGEIVTDNGYLSLLLETGLIGLAGFLAFSAAVLWTSFRVSRSSHEAPAFWGKVLFAIWCGELVQLLAADAYTYWRNITIFAAMMALMMNLSERSKSDGATV
jgi:O-antigen ligase